MPVLERVMFLMDQRSAEKSIYPLTFQDGFEELTAAGLDAGGMISDVPTLTPRDLSLSARVGLGMEEFYRMLIITGWTF